MGAILADQYFGIYKAILSFALGYEISLFLLWVTAPPLVVEHGMALARGAIAYVALLIADQYNRKTMEVRTQVSEPAST